jgi:segregation and condensation protein A
MKSFQKVVERFEKEKNKPVHQIVSFPYTIQLSKSQILDMVKHQSRIAFEAVFDVCDNRVHAIYHFLSILELVQERMLNITIGEGFNNFWISAEEATAE